MRMSFNTNDVGRVFYHRLNGQRLLLCSLVREEKKDVSGIPIIGASSGMMRCVQNCPQRGPFALAHGEFYAFEVADEKPTELEGQFIDVETKLLEDKTE